MTNKEMVLVPRELLERIETWVQADCQALIELQALLAAPPEDVRAVVDEPVAYAVFTDKGHIRIWSSDCDAVGLKVEAEEGRKAVPLYLHPQLPMVLPERQDPGPALHQWPQGWNACLDEISRLNK